MRSASTEQGSQGPLRPGSVVSENQGRVGLNILPAPWRLARVVAEPPFRGGGAPTINLLKPRGGS